MTREEQIREAAFVASCEDKPIYKREVVANGMFMATEEVKLRDCDRPIARHFFKRGAQWADANQPSTWISVEERLPEPEKEVIILDKRKHIDIDFLTDNGEDGYYWWKSDETIWCEEDKITHWMPIPEL